MTSDELLAAFQEVTYERLPVPNYSGCFADTNGDIWFGENKLEVKMFGGYYKVYLGNYVQVPVHILVCLAFHGQRPLGELARHLDDDRSNNVPDNLMWGTQKQNGQDGIRNGKFANNGSLPGEDNGFAKLSLEQAKEIKRRALNGEDRVKLGREFSITRQHVRNIMRGSNWKDA